MKRLLTLLSIVLKIIVLVWAAMEFCAVPALLVIIGLLNDFPWQYYAIIIGGYLAIFIVVEIISYFVCKVLDKKYSPLIERKLEKYFDKCEKN